MEEFTISLSSEGLTKRPGAGCSNWQTQHSRSDATAWVDGMISEELLSKG